MNGSRLISPVHIQVQFPVPFHQQRELDLYVPESPVQLPHDEPETVTSVPSHDSLSIAVLLIKFLFNLAVLVFGDFRSLLTDVYEILITDVDKFEPIQQGEEYCAQRHFPRSSSFVLSCEDIGEDDQVLEDSIEISDATNKKPEIISPSFSHVISMSSWIGGYLKKECFVMISTFLHTVQDLNSKTIQVFNEGFLLEFAHDILQTWFSAIQ